MNQEATDKLVAEVAGRFFPESIYPKFAVQLAENAIREAISLARKEVLDCLVVWRCWNCEHELYEIPVDPFGPCPKCKMDGAGHKIFSPDYAELRRLSGEKA